MGYYIMTNFETIKNNGFDNDNVNNGDINYNDPKSIELIIAEDGMGISELYFLTDDRLEYMKACGHVNKKTTLLRNAERQLREYFESKRTQFDLPLSLNGTSFQKKVWNALLRIPYGETRSYKDVAEDVGHPKAYRAVGMANNKNKISIIIPCHRVVGSDGSLTGYGGGMDKKAMLLRLETCHSQGRGQGRL